MKVYCPTCGNEHVSADVSCRLCGTEFDNPQMQLAARNLIMKRAIQLWQEAGSPGTMEGHFLEKAEGMVAKEMENKTVTYMNKMADDTADLLKKVAGFCRTAEHDGQAYDWNFSACEAMAKAQQIVNLIANKVPPTSGSGVVFAEAAAVKKGKAIGMPGEIKWHAPQAESKPTAPLEYRSTSPSEYKSASKSVADDSPYPSTGSGSQTSGRYEKFDAVKGVAGVMDEVLDEVWAEIRVAK